MATTTPDPTLAAPVSRRHPWAYRDEPGTRDRRLDLLRGYALAAMAINHFGLSQSYLHEASGRSGFLVSAAEAFLFISGFTLGFITIGRTPEQATTRLAARTWTVYLATIGISLGLGVVALTTHLQLWGELEAESYDGAWSWLGQVLTLRTAFNGADILIAYVIYLTAAIAALRLMTAGRTSIVVAATAGAYALSQLAGAENVMLGFASFRALLPNAPLFLGGLVIGFHRHRVAAVWNAMPLRHAVDGAVIATAVVLAWLHANGWSGARWLGERIAGPELTEPLGLREFEMPIVPLVVVLLYLRVGWIVADAVWVPLRRALGWFLLPLGEASLFTFTMHLVAIPIIVNLPWWPGEDVSRAAATGWVVAYLAVIYLAVLVRQRILAWLRVDRPERQLLRRHGPVAAVGVGLAVVVLLGATPGGAAGPWGQPGGDEDEIDEFAASIEDEIGGAIDAFVDGELDAGDLLAELPRDVSEADRSEIAGLLETDPFAAEEALVRLLRPFDDG